MEPVYSIGDRVYVLAKYWDKAKASTDERWSSRFENGGDEKILGEVKRFKENSSSIWVEFDDGACSVPLNVVHPAITPESVVSADPILPTTKGKEKRKVVASEMDTSVYSFEQGEAQTIKGKKGRMRNQPLVLHLGGSMPTVEQRVPEPEESDPDDLVDTTPQTPDVTDDETDSEPEVTCSVAGTTDDEEYGELEEAEEPLPGIPADLQPPPTAGVPVTQSASHQPPQPLRKSDPNFVKRRKRKVKSLDTCLDPTNYTPTPDPEAKDAVRIHGVLQKKVIRKLKPSTPEIRITFSNVEGSASGRHAAHDIVENRPGVTFQHRLKKLHLECFGIFFTLDMVGQLTKNTNERITETMKSLSPEVLGSSKYPHVSVLL